MTTNLKLGKPTNDEKYNVQVQNANMDILDSSMIHKVDKIDGMGLTSNDYTTEEKNKLSGIEPGAQKNTINGIKGEAENSYRIGNVNITKANIGLNNVPNVATNEQTPTFSEPSTRANIISGEKLSVILGKIKKIISDLKAVAFSGSYNDLTDKPAIPSGTNNLMATVAGTWLDATQGKILDEKITSQNNYFANSLKNISYSRFRMADNITIDTDIETDSILPINVTITNADPDNFVINSNNTITVKKPGIYLVFGKVHGAFGPSNIFETVLSAHDNTFATVQSNTASKATQFRNCVSGAFIIKNGQATVSLGIRSLSGTIHIYPSSMTAYTEIVIVKIKGE